MGGSLFSPGPAGGRQVRQQPRLLACLRKRRPGLSHEPGGQAGQPEREGESGDLRGSLAVGLEAAPGCRVRSTSPFPGLYPTPAAWWDVSPAVCLSAISRPTAGSGPLLGSHGAREACVPSNDQPPRGLQLRVLCGRGVETPARAWEGRTLPPNPPSPTSLQLFKASGGRGKLL